MDFDTVAGTPADTVVDTVVDTEVDTVVGAGSSADTQADSSVGNSGPLVKMERGNLSVNLVEKGTLVLENSLDPLDTLAVVELVGLVELVDWMVLVEPVGTVVDTMELEVPAMDMMNGL